MTRNRRLALPASSSITTCSRGRTRPDRDWHPLDGRIVELGLHCTFDPAVGNNVQMTIGADSAELRGGKPTHLS